MKVLLIKVFCACVFLYASQVLATCQDHSITLQVLGSGGPELDDQRASTSYLVWVDGKATLLVDLGSGSSLNFEKAAANFNDIKAIALSHLHVDHSADLPAYIKSSFFVQRATNLPIYGPDGNGLMPSTLTYVKNLLGSQGAFRYLDNYVVQNRRSRYKINPINVLLEQPRSSFSVAENIRLTAVPVHHGPIAAVAWRADIYGCSITFSGDMSNRSNVLATLAKETDILVAHNAIPESERGFGRVLHMPPSEIGKIAQQADVKQLVLSHRMNRTLGKEQETLENIRLHYSGKVKFANDLDKFDI